MEVPWPNISGIHFQQILPRSKRPRLDSARQIQAYDTIYICYGI